MARTIIGTVVSDKADKTIVLVSTERKTHPIYKKQYSRTVKYIAHDEKNEANVGDKVEVAEVRPISARKKLNLVKILERASIAHTDTVDAITAEPQTEEQPVKNETKNKEKGDKK